MTPPRPQNILVIEDDRTLNNLLIEQLGRLGYGAQGVETRAKALEVLAGFRPDVALLDLRLPDADGLKFLPELREYCPVIILTAYGSINQAVQTVRAGATDYLVKPISGQSLELALKRFFDTTELMRDLAFWQAQARHGLEAKLVGTSPEMTDVCQLVSLFASSDAPVLILGESGVGKERVAHALHAASPRSNGRMILIDCDGGPSAAELFGALHDTQSGKISRHDGLIAAAESGTIFLSGVERLAPDLQAKLLRTIETGTYRPAGSSASVPTQARFIVSACLSPGDIAPEGHAHNELLFRLSTFSIYVPPLRDRRADVTPLAESFLASRNFQRNIPKGLSDAALQALNAYDWPGNVRELRNAIERGLIMSSGDTTILPEHFGLTSSRTSTPVGATTEVALRFDRPPTMDELRDDYLRLLLKNHEGNRRRVASILGISERNTYRLIQKLNGVDPEGMPDDS